MIKSYKELIGAKFNKLTVLKITRISHGVVIRPSALCKCDCGNELIVRIDCLKDKNTQSCGCLKIISREKVKTHGLTNHPLYWILQGIKGRCNNPNYIKYHLYGGKGVRVCDEWLNNPAKFVKWALENGWRKGLQIDKDIIPRNLGLPALIYSPEMCSIVSNRENTNNRNTTVIITHNGETLPLTIWAERLGIHPATIQNRLKRGWPSEQVLNTQKFAYRTGRC